MKLGLINKTALAREVGVSSMYIGLIFRGERTGMPVLPRIAAALGVTVEWLQSQIPPYNNGQRHAARRRSKQASPLVAARNLPNRKHSVKAPSQ